MTPKAIAFLATGILATSMAMAQDKPAQKCGAGSCSKKTKQEAASHEQGAAKPDANCSKKEGTRDASCSKKDGAKPDANCSKK